MELSEAAKDYVRQYEWSMHFARQSISTLRPLIYDERLQAALDGSFENHIFVHLRNVLVRDVVSFVWKSFDQDYRAVSLRKLVSHKLRQEAFWKWVEDEWKQLNGGSLIHEAGRLTVVPNRRIAPWSGIKRIRLRLNDIAESDEFNRIQRFRNSIVAHLENESLSVSLDNRPTFDELFEVAERVYELGLATIHLITLVSPTAHIEDTREYSAEFWGRLAGTDPLEVNFGDYAERGDWMEEILA